MLSKPTCAVGAEPSPFGPAASTERASLVLTTPKMKTASASAASTPTTGRRAPRPAAKRAGSWPRRSRKRTTAMIRAALIPTATNTVSTIITQ